MLAFAVLGLELPLLIGRPLSKRLSECLLYLELVSLDVFQSSFVALGKLEIGPLLRYFCAISSVSRNTVALKSSLLSDWSKNILKWFRQNVINS